MSHFANAFGKSFADNKDLIRTRSFQMGGHTFKVKVPLTSEYDAMIERMKTLDDNKVNDYYNILTKEFINNKDNIIESLGVVFKDNDIEIQGRSMRETAKNKYLTEYRVVEMIKLLVPEEPDFDMSSITYEMVEELFPFSIQLELIEKISEVISPGYKEARGK